MDIGFNLPNPMLELLVEIERKSFLLNVETLTVLIVKLSLDLGFELISMFVKSTVLFNFELVTHGIQLTVESEIEFTAHAGFFTSKSVMLKHTQILFHSFSHFFFKLI